MKKLVCVIGAVITMAVVFAAARPSLDGRAVIADSGVMPKGLFARTIGYLPGDSVTVTNPATGKTVDVLILGSIDPSEGVAILLSSEAGDALNIKKDSNIQVKITKRAGSLDESVSGSAILDEDYREAGKIIDEVPAEAEITEEQGDSAIEYEASESTDEGMDSEQNILPLTEEVEEVLIDEEAASDTENTAEYSDDFEEITIEEDVYSEETDESKLEEEQILILDEESSDDTIEDETDEYVEIESLDESEDKNFDETVSEQDIVLTYDENEAKEDEETVTTEEKENENQAEESLDTIADDEKVAEDIVSETDTQSYAPIILVPSQPNPPEAVAKSDLETKINVSNETDVSKESLQKETEIVTEEKTISSYVVKSLKDLNQKSYYIQIATLGNEENIMALIKKYGDKYPIVLVPLSSGKAYQVMVGPLNIDEYGAVVERFKSYGYKDCFVRKIK